MRINRCYYVFKAALGRYLSTLITRYDYLTAFNKNHLDCFI